MTSPGQKISSIRAKLARLVFLSVGCSLVLAGMLNTWTQAEHYLAFKRESLLATGQAFGAASSRSVAAGDKAAIMQAIRAIGRVPGLLRAEVYGANGELLGEIGSAVRLEGDIDLTEATSTAPLALLHSRTVEVSVPVVNGGATVGQIGLISDTAGLADRLLGVLLVTAIGSLIALALGLGLAHRLQRAITQPLVSLTAAMTSVERTNDYKPVSGISSNDEVGLLAGRFNRMIEEIRRQTDELLDREDEIITRLSKAGEQRDDQTGQHVVRVAKVSRIIADALGLDPKWIADFVRASPMHDVGKIAVPDAILFKPGRLDPEERSKMERHAEDGHRVLAGSSSTLVQLAAEISLTHHEKWDGTGYPRRLAGSDIPISGRITAVADVCDALLSRRPYKEPWSLEKVKAHLAENAGSHFDPACVAALLERWPDLERVYEHAGDDGAAERREAA